MRDNHNRVAWHAQVPAPSLSQRDEGARYHGDRGNTPLFRLNSVVETPRSARPSVCDRVDHGVCPRR